MNYFDNLYDDLFDRMEVRTEVMECYRLTEEEYRIILEIKRDLHMHPELSRSEFETTKRIRCFLDKLADFQIIPVKTATGTGLVARIEACGSDFPENMRKKEAGGLSSVLASENEDAHGFGDVNEAVSGSGDVIEIMLRADIDALPQTEEFESPWKSQVPGVMHACGHDFHTASLLGAALLLQRAKKDGALRADVDLVFQPAEEGTTGAGLMIDAGLFDMIHPDLCFGIHNWPSVQTGRIACHEGPLMSGKRNFEIIIHGTGGHGSMPHLSTDPIVCAAAVIQSLQTVVSRNTNPLDSVILTVNMIEGGSRMNLIADRVRMLATVRSLSDDALDRAIERIRTIVECTAQAYECGSEINWSDRIPAVWNSPEMTDLARRCAAEAGFEVVDAPPSLASEDFARYRAFVPSFFYWVGSTAAGEQPVELHKPFFHTDDTALRCAAELYMTSVMVSAEKWTNKKL